jgi:hypothetical protein
MDKVELQKQAFGVVIDNMLEGLEHNFFEAVTNITSTFEVSRTDKRRARLRQIGSKFQDVVRAKKDEWVHLIAKHKLWKEEIDAREEADEMEGPILDPPVYDSDDELWESMNFNLRHRTTADIQAEEDRLYEQILFMGDWFGCSEDGYESEDEDLPDRYTDRVMLPTLRYWAALPEV